MLQDASGNVTIYNELQKPLIHTFFTPLDGRDPMIDTWKEEWEKAGWRTKILTMDDAMRHPDFKSMRDAVIQVFEHDIYNQFCFYRYLAMALVGGGWMSDYDAFPTNFPINEASELPNHGQFTSFQAHVPSLISADADEWTRIASLMVEQLPNSEAKLKSDMYVLKEVGENKKNQIKFEIPCRNVRPKIAYKEKDVVDCKEMSIGRAIHISHLSVAQLKETGTYPEERMAGTPHDEARAKLSSMFMDDWREQCGGSDVTKVQ